MRFSYYIEVIKTHDCVHELEQYMLSWALTTTLVAEPFSKM